MSCVPRGMSLIIPAQKGKFMNVVSTNIDMSRVLAADWIYGHGDSRQILFVDIRTTFLKVAEILKDITDVHDLLSTLIGSHVFGFRRGKGDVVLSAGPPADWTSVKQQDKACPQSSSNQPREHLQVSDHGQKECLFVRACSASKVPKDMNHSGHM